MTARDAGARTQQPTADSESYRNGLRRFLAGSDEKARTHTYLDSVVHELPTRRVLLDIGPAEGTTPRHLSPFFERTVCIEPSAPMRRQLQRTCPAAHIVAEPVLEANPGTPADLVLLSHILYYIPRTEWVATVERTMNWVTPGGTALILLQDPDNACMRMVHHFTGARFDLRELADELTTTPLPYDATPTLDTIAATYRSADLDEAVDAAMFHLMLPSTDLPSREMVTTYVHHHFADTAEHFTIPHEQLSLRIQRPLAGCDAQ